MPNTLTLFKLPLVNEDRPTAIQQLLSQPRKITAAFINAHCVNTAAKDKKYTSALRQADFLLPDGAGISLAAKMTGRKLVENLNGTDLCEPFCRAAAAQGKSIFLLGAKPGIASDAADNLIRKIPGLRIAGVQHGFFAKQQTDRVIEEINASGADIVMVAMGVPMQELWIQENRDALNAGVIMGVGALFDFVAGHVQRAPTLIRKAKLEWAWRLALEPRRMFKRYVLGNPAFVGRAILNAKISAPASRPAMTVSKRALDITVSLAALLALSPVLAATMLSIKATSRGAVFFYQERVGHRGERFKMIKFRSMYQDAEARRADLLAQSERDGVCFKMKHDPRVTRIGRFIRRYSIDELPQLWNVLRGDMSLVGPRPALPSEVAAYPTGALRRLDAIPGITGIWQVSGRAEISFDRMIAMDVAYLKSRSILLDILLLGLTARAVFSGRGAY